MVSRVMDIEEIAGIQRRQNRRREIEKSPTLRERGGLESQAGRDAEQGDAMRGGMPPRLADGLFYLFEVDVLGGGVSTVGGIV